MTNVEYRSSQMKSLTKWLFASLAICTLAGCATVPDPVVRTEQKENIALLPVKKVLVVIDLGIEFEYLPGGIGFSKEDNAKLRYEPIAKEMIKELKALGLEADYVLHTQTTKPVIPAGYTHLWVQRLNNFLLTTYSKGGQYVSGRVWTATISQRQWSMSGDTFALVYRSEFASDGSECFSPRVLGNKDDCQKKFIATVVPQWRKSGLGR
jgi:hypothetical protein